MAETDNLYQRLVAETMAIADSVENQKLDPRCCEQTPEALGNIARTLQEKFELANSLLAGAIPHCEAAAGLALWQLGYIGEIMYPIDGSPGLLERGELEPWEKKYGIKRQRFQDARHVYKRFERGEARKLGYRGMMQVLQDEKNEGEESDKEKKRKKKKRGQKHEWTLRGDLVKTLERVVSNLTTIIKRLPIASDRCGDPAKNYPAIIEARALLQQVQKLYPEVEGVLDTAEEQNSDENRDRAEHIREELRLHPVHGSQDHAESEISTVLPIER